jgi:hypothetical protein
MSVPTPADAVAAINAMEAASLNPIEKARLLREVSVIVKQLLWTSEELLDKLCKNCLFSQDPELALHYYHGCSMDHDAWLYNNETLSNPATLKRVHDALENPVGQAEAVELHKAVSKNQKNSVFACASCNEIQIPEWGHVCKQHTITEVLHSSLHLTRSQQDAIDGMTELQIEHTMAYKSKANDWYHLNPDLVNAELEEFTLCHQCSRAPSKKGHFSITNGFDPGRRGKLNPKPLPSTARCIGQVRIFKSAQFTIREKERKGHVILFPTDAPSRVAERLPWIEKCLPEIVFYGTPTQWNAGKDKWEHMMRLNPTEVHEYLRVLKAVHQDYGFIHVASESETEHVFANEKIQVAFPKLTTLADTGDDVDREPENHAGQDAVVITTSAMIQTTAIEEGVLETHDILLPPTDFSPQNPAPIRAEVSNIPETWFSDLRQTLGRVFPHLFLTGKGIPKTLTHSYWRHLCRHYDGRFQADAEFVTTIFSLMMRQSASFQGLQSKKNNPEALEFVGELVNSGHLREMVDAAKTSETDRKEVEGILSHLFSVFAKKTPFSPLTMATARSKIKGGKLRHNTGQQFLTGKEWQ